MANKKLLSGVKPTGRPHIGNYLGAMRQFVELQEGHDSLFMIADYHALNFIQNPAEMTENIIGVALDYLAIGLDPKKSIIFKQSDVPAHTELTWIFNTITTMPYLMRGHAYKDAQQKDQEVSVGTFDYPILMAADILTYDPDIVPVGQDQKQHVEFARDTAEKFNRIFGPTFKVPEEYILSDVATVPGIDGRKMSKSYNNTIPLFAEDEELQKQVMSIVTDSKSPEEPKNPDECNVFALHKFFSTKDLPELERRYREGGIGYKESKEILAENLKQFIAPLRETRKELAARDGYALDVLRDGGERACVQADAKITDVRAKIGVSLY